MLLNTISEILDEILSYLFQGEYRRLGAWVNRLVRENAEAYGDSNLQGFVHNGVVYKPTDLKLPNQAVKRRGLHPSVMPTMDAYLRDVYLLMNDKAFIRQALFKVIDGCDNPQELRDALPNCLADAVACTRGLDRRGEMAFTIRDNARAMRDFEKILPRIEMYAAARLLY